MKNHIITIKNPACYDLDPYIGKERTRRGLSGLLGRSPDPSESPRTFAASAANW